MELDRWQAYLDILYENREQQYTPEYYKEWFQQLPTSGKIAITLAHLNYQVENGGFGQWLFNEYPKDDDFLNVMSLIQSHTSNQKILKGLELAEAAIRLEIQRDDENRTDFEDEEYTILDALDQAFYNLNFAEAVEEEFGEWFLKETEQLKTKQNI